MDCIPSQIKNKIVKVARLLYQNRMVNAYEGNISARCGNKVYFTPSGVCKGFLEADMLVVTDMDGKILSRKRGYMLTSEAKMHLSIYHLREDAGSVVHTHSPWATAYAIANKPISTKAYPEMIVLFGEIPVAKYGMPSTDEVCLDFARLLMDKDVILIGNHGVVSLGKDAFDAYFKIEAAESCARVLAIAEMIGGSANLDEKELGRLYNMRKELFGRD